MTTRSSHRSLTFLRLAACALTIGALSACSSQKPSGDASQDAQRYVARARGNYTPPGPPGDPWGPYITEASGKYDVPERWVREVIRQESGGRMYENGKLITSNAGAMGLMQVMPATYAELRARYDLGEDPFDPHDNIMAGTAYLRELYDIYGAPGFLAAYNAGPGRLDDYLTRNRPLPDETRRYVARIGPNLGDAQPQRVTVTPQYAMLPNNIPAGPRYPRGSRGPAPVALADNRPASSSFARVPVQSASLTPPPAAPPASAPVQVAALAPVAAPAKPSGFHLIAPAMADTMPSQRGAPTTGNWAIQVGAFANEAQARAAADTAKRQAIDDRTFVFRLNKPFAFLPNALAKTQPTCVIMPERLAGDPFKQAAEAIGSGPFRWIADEFVSGSRAVFARNERYIARPEKVEYGWGGYHVKVDRVEWRVIPDAATAAGALATGEVDWVEMPLPDLLPTLRKAPGVKVERLDTHGIYPVLRPNFLHGPTTNPAVRRAMLAAIDQVDEMTAVMGEDRDGWRAPIGFFIPGTESASEAGMKTLRERPSPDAIKAMLKAGGYNGERIVLMHPTDPPAYDALCQVAEGAFRRVGLNIDIQTTDWGTVTQRRNSKEPLEKGGWSIFPSGFPAVDFGNPVLATGLRTNGKDAWIGWPENPKLEALRDAWIDSSDPVEQKRISEQIQLECVDFVPYIPLGQYIQATAWRTNITGLLRGPAPVFWNIEKS